MRRALFRHIPWLIAGAIAPGAAAAIELTLSLGAVQAPSFHAKAVSVSVSDKAFRLTAGEVVILERTFRKVSVTCGAFRFEPDSIECREVAQVVPDEEHGLRSKLFDQPSQGLTLVHPWRPQLDDETTWFRGQSGALRQRVERLPYGVERLLRIGQTAYVHRHRQALVLDLRSRHTRGHEQVGQRLADRGHGA